MIVQMLGGSVLAAEPVGPSDTAEFNLVQSIFALQGSSSSSQQQEQQVLGMLARYAQSAPQKNRRQRLQEALVRLGAFTPEQAQAFFADARSSALKVTNSSSEIQSQQVLESEITRLMQVHLAGAQFSGCKDWTDLAWAGGVAMIGLGVYANSLFSDNPTCGYTYSDNPVPGSIANLDGTGYYLETCSKPNYYPHRQLGLDMEIGAGAGIVVLVLLAFVEGHC